MLFLLVSTVVFFYGGFRVQVASVVTVVQFSRWLPDFRRSSGSFVGLVLQYVCRSLLILSTQSLLPQPSTQVLKPFYTL